MAELWGAAGGIDAGLERQRLSTLTDMGVLKTLGDLAELPGKLDLQKAHARYYNAEAADKENDAGANKYIGAAAAQMQGGTDATSSPSNPLYALSAMAFKGGYVKQGTALLEKASTISFKEQQLLTSQASEQLRKIRSQDLQLQEASSIASSLAADPENYAAHLLALKASPNKTPVQQAFIDSLPETYDEAKDSLVMTRDQAIKASDQMKAAAKKLVDDANIKRLGAQAKASTASAAAAVAREKLSTQLLNNREKNDGDNSASVTALRNARIKALGEAKTAKDAAVVAKAEAQASIDRKRFPPPTAEQIKDPSKLLRGESYSTPKGVLTWTGTGFVPLRQAAPAAEPDDTENDDDLDDSDE